MRILALLAVVVVGLAACAHVPIVSERQLQQEASGTQSIRVYGTKGPLSARQAGRVLARVAAQAPNADALDRHLALEQIIAKGPLYAGNSVRVLQDGAATFPAMFSAIAGAKQFLDIEYYIFQDVQSGGRDLGDLLVQKSRAGVHVRVIYDAVGSLGTPASFYDKLRAGGVQVVQYNPINPLKARTHYSPNDRDHRKILVADDEIGIVGGVNLSTDYESAPSLKPGIAPKTTSRWRSSGMARHRPGDSGAGRAGAVAALRRPLARAEGAPTRAGHPASQARGGYADRPCDRQQPLEAQDALLHDGADSHTDCAKQRLDDSGLLRSDVPGVARVETRRATRRRRPRHPALTK